MEANRLFPSPLQASKQLWVASTRSDNGVASLPRNGDVTRAPFSPNMELKEPWGATVSGSDCIPSPPEDL